MFSCPLCSSAPRQIPFILIPCVLTHLANKQIQIIHGTNLPHRLHTGCRFFVISYGVERTLSWPENHSPSQKHITEPLLLYNATLQIKVVSIDGALGDAGMMMVMCVSDVSSSLSTTLNCCVLNITKKHYND